MSERPTALVADDERLLREQLQARLAECWPELQLLASARDGLEAVRLADELRPSVVFLDIRMPGLTGIEAAREIAALDGWRGEIVFATAYDEYAVTAFEEGAVDYLLKPVERARLDITVARLRARLAKDRKRCQRIRRSTRQRRTDALLHTLAQLQSRLGGQSKTPRLRWLQCGAGNSTRLVSVDEVLFFRSDEKYTRVQTAATSHLSARRSAS
jgi:DNA-binding LytR/AlgR family response regulator